MGDVPRDAGDRCDRPEAAEFGAASRKAFTRRRLLKFGAGALGAGLLGGGIYWAARPTVRIGLIGAGVRGRYHAGMLAWFHRGWPIDVQVRHVVDVDRDKAQRVAKKHAPQAHVGQDYRRVLADDNVDAVIIATCNHWHAKMSIEAMQAGKAVYCEKPLSITFAEGQQILEAASITKAVFQLGTQQRHFSTFRTFAELVLNGRIGEVRHVEILLGENRFDPTATWCSGLEPPEPLDWNLWLGPTQFREYCPAALQGWGNIFQFSGGQVLNWGSHYLDNASWILEEMYGPNWFTSCRIVPQAEFVPSSELFDVPRRFRVDFELPAAPRLTVASVEKSESTGIRFTGTKGRALVNRAKVVGKPVEQLQDAPLPSDRATIGDRMASRYGAVATAYHLHDFLHCVVYGGTPLSDVASSVRMNAVLQLANVACRVNEPLHWNQERHSFEEADVANRHLRREWRHV